MLVCNDCVVERRIVKRGRHGEVMLRLSLYATWEKAEKVESKQKTAKDCEDRSR
jgi:hypothetical protein